jgi:DNA-binding CsgD family transcriptional regulator
MAELGLVGRASELAQLAALLDAAQPGVVLIEGEAGIGKTRLLEALDAMAAARGVPVRWGRATDEEGAPPFWPWRQVIQPWPMLEAATAEQRFALFETISATLASHGALVVILDDLHWADAPTLLLLSHLARHSPAAPLLIACAARPAELRRDDRAREIIATLARQRPTSRLELTGLSPAEVAEQLDTAGYRCAPAVVREVARRTGGNPLFVKEFGRLLASGGNAAEVPDAVRDAITQHLGMLPAPCRSVLAAAAVLGVDLDTRLLAAVTELAVADVLNYLDQARAAGVLDGSRFAHDLVRDCLRLELPSGERAGIHLRAAEQFAAMGEHVSEVAHHRLAALPLGDPTLAVKSAIAAAELAMGQLGFEEAINRYDRALPAAADPESKLALLIGKATAQHAAHDIGDAMRTCEQAAELAIRTGNARALGETAVVLQDTSDLSWLLTVEPWCARALAGLPEHDSRLRTQLLAQQSTAWIFSGDHDRLDGASNAALAMAERLDDPVALTAALRARQLVRSDTDGNAERVLLGDRMIALSHRTARRYPMLWGHLWRFDAFVQAGRIDEAEAELVALEPVVAGMRAPLARWHLVRAWSAMHLGRGRFAEALDTAGEALKLAEDGEHGPAIYQGHILRLSISRFTGDESTDPDLATLDMGFPPSALFDMMLAERHIEFGRQAEVALIYNRISLGVWARMPLSRIVYESYRGVLAAAVGDTETAEAAYASLLPDAEFHVVSGAGVVATRGSVQQYLGRMALGLGRTEDAIEHFRGAVAANTRAGLPPHVAESQYRLAELLYQRDRPGDLEEATLAVRESAAIAARLGMRLLIERTGRLLAGTQARRGGTPLSRREEEIARLIAGGQSNRQIAAVLVISERTVETHVRNILTKLGFQARTQIASWATARRLTP